MYGGSRSGALLQCRARNVEVMGMDVVEGRRARPYVFAALRDRNAESDDDDTRSAERRRIPRLVQDARAGDRDSFGDLYRIHHPAVYRLARFSLPPAAVEDAVAETFLRAWAGLARYRDTGAPFAAWLHGIARHVVADVHRNAARLEVRDELPEGTSRFDHQETDRILLADAIARLAEDQRQVIELKFLVGLANPDVARAMGKSIGAVNAMQWRALANLRRIVGEI